MYKIIWILACIVLLLPATSIAAQDTGIEKYVYLVISNSPGGETRLTGFRMRGKKGIITALHGVVGSKSITASNEIADVLADLEISEVDIDNDLALLTSRELLQRPDEGLDPLQGAMPISGAQLIAYEHPEGAAKRPKPVRAGIPVLRTLDKVIPPDSATLFATRKSPFAGPRERLSGNVWHEPITILNIDGSLVKGSSGGPVINSNEEVIAVADGGLGDGAAAISWAIPIRSIKWVGSGSINGRLTALAQLDRQLLFGKENTGEPATKIIPITRQIAISDFGQVGEIQWLRRPQVGSSRTELQPTRRNVRVVSIDTCNLVVEQTIEVQAPAEPLVGFMRETNKMVFTTSIPLNRVNASAIEENQSDFLAPVAKWGIRVTTPEKEIDSELNSVDQLGDQPEEKLNQTVSDDGLYLVIGTRKEAIAFWGVLKQAINRCQN